MTNRPTNGQSGVKSRVHATKKKKKEGNRKTKRERKKKRKKKKRNQKEKEERREGLQNEERGISFLKTMKWKL